MTHGEHRHEDTPGGAADRAWKIREHLSGLTRADYEKIREK